MLVEDDEEELIIHTTLKIYLSYKLCHENYVIKFH